MNKKRKKIAQFTEAASLVVMKHTANAVTDGSKVSRRPSWAEFIRQTRQAEKIANALHGAGFTNFGVSIYASDLGIERGPRNPKNEGGR